MKSTADSWRYCNECERTSPIGEWVPGCPHCGAVLSPMAENQIEIRLEFAVSDCPACGEPGPGGTCAVCGGDVPLPEPSPGSKARSRALGPLRAQAWRLVESFQTFPDPHIPVTTNQTVAVIVDADLPQRAIALIQFAHRFGELDLETPAKIGSETRSRVLDALSEVAAVRDETRRLAAFQPPSEIDELPALQANLTARAAEAVAWCLEVISAERLAAANHAAEQLQRCLEPPPESDRIHELLAISPGLQGAEDIDARASLALGIDGQYADELGLIDPRLIFAAACELDSPMKALALGAGRYLAHLLETAADDLPEGAAMLALGAVPLAVLDRPFGPHRQAELARKLLRRASTESPSALAAAFERYDDDQGRAVTAVMRARRAIRRLIAGEPDDAVDAIESAVAIYKRIAEGPFRTNLRFLLAARAAAENREVPKNSLLLGDIDGMLEGWTDELGLSLQGVSDRDLRNAEAHEDFHVQPSTLVITTTSGRQITLEELDNALERLNATIAAIDVAVLCHRIDSPLESRPPQWLTDGAYDEIRTILLATVGAAYGIALVDLRTIDGAAILELDGEAPGRSLARTLIAAALPMTPEVDEFRVQLNGELIVAVSAELLRSWSTAHPDERDLALIELLFDSHIRTGDPPEPALLDALTAQLRMVLKVDVPQIAAAPEAHTPRARLSRRLRRIQRFARSHQAGWPNDEAHVLTDLRRANAAAIIAANDPGSDLSTLPALTEPLGRLEAWSDARGVLPPEYSGEPSDPRSESK